MQNFSVQTFVIMVPSPHFRYNGSLVIYANANANVSYSALANKLIDSIDRFAVIML